MVSQCGSSMWQLNVAAQCGRSMRLQECEKRCNLQTLFDECHSIKSNTLPVTPLQTDGHCGRVKTNCFSGHSSKNSLVTEREAKPATTGIERSDRFDILRFFFSKDP